MDEGEYEGYLQFTTADAEVDQGFSDPLDHITRPEIDSFGTYPYTDPPHGGAFYFLFPIVFLHLGEEAEETSVGLDIGLELEDHEGDPEHDEIEMFPMEVNLEKDDLEYS